MSGSQESLFKTVEGYIVHCAFDDKLVREALSFKAKAGDIFVATYPKCGTTWTQMIVYLICSKGNPPANGHELSDKIPFLEHTGLKFVGDGKEPYGIKVHLPFELTPYSEYAKYIYVARNPKDVIVSFYHHHGEKIKKVFGEDSFSSIFDMFMDGEIECGNFFDHVLGWYEHRNDNNVLFLTYEEMKKDTSGSILRIGRFMGDNYGNMLEKDPELMENVLKYSGLNEMREVMRAKKAPTEDASKKCAQAQTEKQVNFPIDKSYLVREGAVGKWRSFLTPEQSERLDKDIETRLSGTELYELWKNV